VYGRGKRGAADMLGGAGAGGVGEGSGYGRAPTGGGAVRMPHAQLAGAPSGKAFAILSSLHPRS